MKRIDALLQQFLDRIGQSEGAPYVGLFSSWRDIVGDRIADHAEPVDVRGSALVVEADHPGWVQMVMMSRAKILRELNRRYPQLSITGMQIRVAGDRAAATLKIVPESGPAAGGATRDTGSADGADQPPASVPPSADEKEALERIKDSDFRDTLESLRQTLEDE